MVCVYLFVIALFLATLNWKLDPCIHGNCVITKTILASLLYVAVNHWYALIVAQSDHLSADYLYHWVWSIVANSHNVMDTVRDRV